MSAKKQIKEWFLKGGSLTPLEALRLFGNFRLADVVFKLKKEGLDIYTEITEENGKAFAKYYIPKKTTCPQCQCLVSVIKDRINCEACGYCAEITFINGYTK